MVILAIAAGKDGSSYVPRLPAWTLLARLRSGEGAPSLFSSLLRSDEPGGSPTRSRGSGSGLPQSLQKNHHGLQLKPPVSTSLTDG